MLLSVVVRCGLLALLLAGATPAQVLFVDHDAGGAGDGSSWRDAFPALGPALDAAVPGTQVWVAQGRYLPPAPDDPDARRATFALPADVELYGGFAGGEATLAERDPQAHPTILSGDLGVIGDPADNAYHVLTAGFGAGRLDGFVVRDGRADGPAAIDQQGALLLSNTSSLLVVGCRFENGQALDEGGAVRATNAHERFVDCAFVGNAANGGGAVAVAVPQGIRFDGCRFEGNGGLGTAPRGGAIQTGALFGDTDLRLSDCTFRSNVSGQGGALDLNGGSAFFEELVLIERCRFEDNSAVHGGALAATGVVDLRLIGCEFAGNSVSNLGGAVALFQCNPLIARSRFTGNSTPFRGGAIAATGNSVLPTGSAPRITDSLFVGNQAERGGALFLNGTGTTWIAGCTLAANSASVAGGGLLAQDLTAPLGTGAPLLRVQDSILWANADAGGSDESAQLDLSGGSALFLEHSTVQGLTGGLGGTGNLGLDPLFADLDGADDLLGTLDDHAGLAPGSPAIDAGDSTLLLADSADVDCDGDLAELQPLDLDGRVRAFDDPSTPDTGAGGAPLVDMGAHEFGSVLPTDVWVDLGGGTPGTAGVPQLALGGTLCAGQPAAAQLSSAAPGVPALLWISLGSTPLPIWGGTLHAFPFAAKALVVTSPAGGVSGQTTWPAGVPAGLEVVFQYLVKDPASPFPFVLSNAVRGTTP